MSRLKIGISNLNTVQLLQKGYHVHQKLEENVAIFPTPTIPLASFGDALEELFNAYEAARFDKSQIALRKQKEQVVRTMIRALGNYVADVSLGDAVKFVAGGFSEVQPLTPIGPVLAPAGMAVDFKKGFSTKLFVKWKRSKGASHYVLEMASEENPGDFQIIADVDQVRCTVENLTPGTTYFFRCTSYGATGKGGTSPVVSCMAI